MSRNAQALERIAFQHNSPLAHKLIGLCEDFLAWAESTRQLRLIDGKLPPITVARLKSCVEYAGITFAPALTKLFRQQLNLTVRVKCFYDLIDSVAMGYVFRDLTATESEAVVNRYSGMVSPNASPVDLTAFDHLDIPIDLSRGKFKALPKSYFMELYLFPAIFLGNEAFSNLSLTAEEHASMILHELGHAIGIVEHLSDFYHRADIASNSVRYLNETANAEVLKSTLQNLDKIDRQNPDQEWSKTFDTLMKGLDNTKIVMHGFRAATAASAAYVLLKFFTAPFRHMITAGRFGRINESPNKASDTVVTQSNMSYFERISDEFVSRHGLGAALVSSLMKTDEYDRTGHINLEFIESIKNNRVIWTIVTSLSIVINFFGMIYYVNDGTYDPDWLRYEHVLQNSMVVFKDETLSPELRSYYLKQTTDLLAQIKTYTGTNRFKIRQIFWGTIMRITSRGSVLDAFITAGISADYDILQRMTNGLIKNPFFFHAARLKDLTTR